MAEIISINFRKWRKKHLSRKIISTEKIARVTKNAILATPWEKLRQKGESSSLIVRIWKNIFTTFLETKSTKISYGQEECGFHNSVERFDKKTKLFGSMSEMVAENFK